MNINKVLLVGNYPPPYGGISVHVQLLHKMLIRAGYDCQVLNVDPAAPASDNYIKINGYLDFCRRLMAVSAGRMVHLHTNGHNRKSWLLALACAWAGRVFGKGSLLTIHSGMAPEFIENNRLLVKAALLPQARVIAVNERICQALGAQGFPAAHTELLPAFLFDDSELTPLPGELTIQLAKFQPLVSLVAFFRPEYGVELFIDALARLAAKLPAIGCAIMGSGEGKEALLAQARARGVAERIIWLGDLDHGRCLTVMRMSQLFVRPTLTDGDSVSVREALQLGVPVVASDVGHRPAGVQLFPAGELHGLVTAVHNSLVSNQVITAPLAQIDFHALLKTYQSISETQKLQIVDNPYEQKHPTAE